MTPLDRDVYRVLSTDGQQLDPASVGGAVQKMETERAGGLAHVARRLAEDAHCARHERQPATDVLWMLCSFDAFDQLFTGRGLGIDETVQILVDTAECAVCG